MKASHTTVRGKIVSEWKRADRQLAMHLVIPPTVTATVYIPAASPGGGPGAGHDAITEGGKPAAQSPAVKFLRMDGNSAVYEVGSGTFDLATALP